MTRPYLKHHLVTQAANPLQLDLHHVAALQERLRLHKQAHATRRPRHDDCAPAQRRAARHVRDDLPHAPDHVVGARLLPPLAVHARREPQPLRVRHQRRARDARPDGREAVKRLGVAELPAGRVR